MAGLSGLTRAGEWWSYKIPPLLAIAYSFMLTSQRTPRESLILAVAGIVSIIAVAAYGYVINDCFDIEVDRRAGKKNSMANRSVLQRSAILLTILAIGWAPAPLVPYGWVACLFLAADFTLPTIYSIPPIRLKERGVLGILSDALAAHLLPTLFLASLMIGPITQDAFYRWGIVLVTAAWYCCVGLRGIITHQILDREADLASGVVTLATSQDSIRLLRWDRRVLYLAEMFFFFVLIYLHSKQTYLLVGAFLLFFVLESLMRIMKWGYFVERAPHQGKRFYLPFANNLFYSLWLPLVLAIELAIRWPILAPLPVVHYLLFSRGRGREHREPIEVLRATFHELRRWITRRRFGWDVVVDRSRWPTLNHSDLDLPSITVDPMRKLVQPWDLRLHSTRYPLAKGESYQLQLLLRASAPRVVTVGVCQGYSPWKDLGFADVIPLSNKWEHFHFDFTATATDASGAIFLWLGGHEAQVDIGDARLVRVTDPGPWKLVLTKPAQAWRSPPNDRSYLVRIDRIKTDGIAWHIKLTARSFKVRKGQLYRVQVSLRSEQTRRLTFGVAQAFPPFDIAGLCEEVVIPEMFEDFQGDFLAERDEEVNVFFWLGADSSIVEILSIDCQPIHLDQRWFLDRAQGMLAWRVSTDDPRRVIVQVPEAADAPEAVALWTPCELGNHGAWNCRFRLRSLRGPRSIDFALLEKHADQWVSLHRATIHLGERGTETNFRFVAIDPAREHRLVLWIAERSDLLLLDEFLLEPVHPGSVWRLEAEQGTSGTIRSIDEQTFRVEPAGPVGRDYWLRLVGGHRPPSLRPQQGVIRLRADADRPVGITFEEQNLLDLGGALKLIQQVRLAVTTQWKNYVIGLPSRERIGDALWVPSIRVGEDSIPVEWQPLEIQEIPIGSYWTLSGNPATQATMVLPADPAAAGRLEIDQPGQDLADLQISHPLSREDLRQPTRWLLRLRADHPREVTVGLGEAGPAWQPLLPPARLRVGTDWTNFCLFTDPRMVIHQPGETFRLFVWLGGQGGWVEWESAQCLTRSAEDLPLSLAESPPARLAFEPARQESWTRVVTVESTDDPFAAQVQFDVPAVSAQTHYRLAIELAADTARSIIATLTQAHEPWQSVGLAREIQVTPEPREFVFDFEATLDETSSRLSLALGQERGGLEIGRAHFRSIAPHEKIFVGSGETRCRRVSIPGQRTGTRFELDATSDPWDVKLVSTPIPLQQGDHYAISVRLRSDRPRTLLVGAGQANPPWQMALPPTKLLVDASWRSFLFPFRAPMDDPATQALFCVGGSDGGIEIDSIQIGPRPASSPWRLEAFEGQAGQLVPPADWPGERFVVLQPTPDPWQIKLSWPDLAIVQGEAYRISLRLRASQQRPVQVGLARDHEPWDNLGLFARVVVGPDPLTWEGIVQASQSENNAAFFLWLGEADGEIDVAEFRWERIDPPTSQQQTSGDGEINP